MRYLLLSVFLLSALVAQQVPDAATLMKQQQEAMKSIKTLQFTTENSIEMGMGETPMKMTFETSQAISNPGKMRSESKGMGASIILVSDGENTWMYNAMNKQYTRKAAALGYAGIMQAMGMRNVPDVSKLQMAQKTLRGETIEIDGRKYDCWVVENRVEKMSMQVPAPGSPQAEVSDMVITTWLDRKLGIDVQTAISMKLQMQGRSAMQQKMTMVKKSLKIDEPIADSVFTFTPPPDAKEVDEILGFSAPKSDLTGKDAPPFEVKSLDGKVFSLASLKDKTVLLDFWATWCAPCRKSMPALEKIHQEYKDKGLVMLAIDAGEDRDTVEAFLKKNPIPYPVALAGESEILSAFQVTAYPTFVLIKDGKVASHQVGYSGEAALRGMLPKN